jgi:hypothetical protein
MLLRSLSTLSMGGFLGSMCSQGSFFTKRTFQFRKGLPGICTSRPAGVFSSVH